MEQGSTAETNAEQTEGEAVAEESINGNVPHDAAPPQARAAEDITPQDGTNDVGEAVAEESVNVKLPHDVTLPQAPVAEDITPQDGINDVGKAVAEDSINVELPHDVTPPQTSAGEDITPQDGTNDVVTEAAATAIAQVPVPVTSTTAEDGACVQEVDTKKETQPVTQVSGVEAPKESPMASKDKHEEEIELPQQQDATQGGSTTDDVPKAGGACDGSADAGSKAPATADTDKWSKYSMGRKDLAKALGIPVAAFSLVYLEIFRDFQQQLSLIFSTFHYSLGLDAARVFFGNFSSIVSFNWPYVFNMSPRAIMGSTVFATVLLITLLCCLPGLLPEQHDEVRDGHEVETWDTRAVRAKWYTRCILCFFTVISTLYQPITQASLSVMMCTDDVGLRLEEVYGQKVCDVDASGSLSCKCTRVSDYHGINFCAFMALLFVSLLFPLYCLYLITKNTPKGSHENKGKRYNNKGDYVGYTDQMYAEDLLSAKQKQCPFHFLYKDYRQKCAWWKTFVMLYKAIFVGVMVGLQKKALKQGIATLILQIMFFTVSYWSTPYLNQASNIMDSTGLASNSLTVLFSLLSIQGRGGAGSIIASILINLVNSVALAIMFACTLWGFPQWRALLKTIGGQLIFHNTLSSRSGLYDSIVKDWDLDSEVQHRVWMRFWDSLILNSFGKPVQDRHQTLKVVAREKGLHRIRAHFVNGQDPDVMSTRAALLAHFEGIDVFWNGRTKRRALSNDEAPVDEPGSPPVSPGRSPASPRLLGGAEHSKTHFGKMYLHDYPFHAVVVFDDSKDVAFLHEPLELAQLLKLNTSTEGASKIDIRRRLRSLNAEMAHFLYTRVEKRRVEDGTEIKSDSNGNTTEKKLYSDIEVLLTFENGRFKVEPLNALEKMRRGFSVSIEYEDGRGSAIKPRTGEPVHFTQQKASIGAAEVGLEDSFEWTDKLQELLCDPHNEEVIKIKYPLLMKIFQDYRARLEVERTAKEDILSSSFWYYIYHHSTSDRDFVEGYFRRFETNKDLVDLPDTHASGLDFLFRRMEFVNFSPANKFWYVYWDDVWEENNDIKKIKLAASVLNPLRATTAIAYKPLPRSELEAVLTKHKIHRYFKPAMLDALYQHMEELQKEPLPDKTELPTGEDAA